MTGQGTEDELASLYAWLRDEDDVRSHASMSFTSAEPRPGELGATFDVIQLVVDGGFQALNFAIAFATWRHTRRSRPQVTITCGDASVSLADEPEMVDVIVRTLT